MSIYKTMMMTAAVIGVASFATTANAAGLLSANSNTGVGINTPAANVGVNTNVDAGVKTRTYNKRSAARVETDGSVSTEAEDHSATTDADGNVTARHSSRIRNHTSSVNGEVDAKAKVYEDNYAEGSQMTEDMNANTGVRAGAGVRTGTFAQFND